VASTSVFTCAAFGILITFMGLKTMPVILNISGASANNFDYAHSYMTVVIGGSIIIMLNYAMGQIIRSEGASKEAMVGMLIGTGTNILLDPLFIFYFKMGVVGAGVATVIGNFIGLLYYILFYVHKKSLVTVSLKKFSSNWNIHAEILKIGIPVAFTQILFSISHALNNNIASSYGDTVVAAMGINMRIITIPILLLISLGMGVQPLVGYSFGAGNIKRLKDSIISATLMGTSIGLFFTVIFILFPEPLFRIFINNDEVVQVGKKILLASTIGIPLVGILVISMNSLQAMGKAVPALFISVSRQGLFYVPAILLLNKFFGFNGMIFSMATADILTALVAFFIFKIIFTKMVGSSADTLNGNRNLELQPEMADSLT